MTFSRRFRHWRFYTQRTVAAVIGAVSMFYTGLAAVMTGHAANAGIYDPHMYLALGTTFTCTMGAVVMYMFAEKYPAHIRAMSEAAIRRMDAARFR